MAVYTSFKKLTDIEIEQEDQRFGLSISNAELADEAWRELWNFFEQNPTLKQEYRISYWRWFVVLSWQKAFGVSGDMFIKMLEEQVPIAIWAKFDVLNVLLRYLAQNYYYREDLGAYFLRLKTAFVESEAVVGEWQNKIVTVKDLNSEYLLLQKRNANSIEKAEFSNKLKQIMFPSKFIKYVYVDQEEGLDIFLSLVNFFQDVDNENISFVLDMILGAKNYQNISLSSSEGLQGTQEYAVELEKLPSPNLANKFESMSKNLEAEIKASESAAVAPATAPKVELEKPVVVKQPPKEIPAPEPQKPAKLTTEQIKSQIESEFKKDVEGNFIDIEGVMRKLEEFAEMYNDSKIADLIYFDEDDNRFKWKV